MSSTRIVLFDFGSGAGWAQEVVRALCAVTMQAMELTHETVPPAEPGKAVQIISLVGQKVLPDIAFFVLGTPLLLPCEKAFSAFRTAAPGRPIIAIKLLEGNEEARTLLDSGANDFLVPPVRDLELRARLWRWVRLDHRRHEATPFEEINKKLGKRRFIGRSELLRQALSNLFKIAASDASVLICGETGTGKEVCARAIHVLSSRSNKAFLAVNCGAIPRELMESMLFGHVAGSYTGASESAKGFIQQAEGGTLFLDEVDALSLALQSKLLRVLQEREYFVVGSPKPQVSNVRIIAASNSDLEEQIAARGFRADLYHRLNVLPMHMPPLRKRPEDVAPLAHHFLEQCCTQMGRGGKEFSPTALKKLTLYDWPGNVRELENAVHRAVVLSDTEVIQAEDIQLSHGSRCKIAESFKAAKRQAHAEFLKRYIAQQLAAHNGNISQAARAGGQDPSSLRAMIRKHQICRLKPVVATRN